MRYSVPLRGDTQRAKILTLLEQGPTSSQDLADKIFLTRSAVLLHLKCLRDAGKVRIAAYETQFRSREIPLYAPGSAPDAPYVKVRNRPENKAYEVQRAKVRGAILAQLRAGLATGPELATLLGLSHPTIRKYLPKMRAERLVYRAAWVSRTEGGRRMALWAAGNADDASQDTVIKAHAPVGLTYEQHDLLRRKNEARTILKIARKKPQGIFAALGV